MRAMRVRPRLVLVLASLVLTGLSVAEPARAHQAHPAAGIATAPAAFEPSDTPDLVPGLTTDTAQPLPVPEAAWSAASPMPGAPWPALALVATLVLFLGVRRPSRAPGLVLALLLSLLAFETGVHSVHHLADGKEAQCAVASASGKLADTLDDSVCPGAGMPVAAPERLLPVDPPVSASRIPSSHRDRGPPDLLATV
jgi:hypothetical protein